MNHRFFFIVLLSALLFALSTPLSKIFLGTFSPLFLAGFFYLSGALFLLPFSWRTLASELRYLKRNRQDRLRIIGGVVSGGIIGPIFLLYGIKLSDATSASLLLNMETVATAIWAHFLFNEHFSKRVLISSMLTVVAGILLVFDFNYNIHWGGVLVMLACFSWGLDNNFTATVQGVSPTTNTIIKGVCAGIFNITLAFCFERDLQSAPLFFYSWTLVGAMVIGALSYGASISLYITGARFLGATRSQILFTTHPFLGGLISYLIFKDSLTINFVLALCLMLLSLFILYYEHHRHTHLHPSEEHEHEHAHDDEHHSHHHQHQYQHDHQEKHTHKHAHSEVEHEHHHYPDLHHRHQH
ncbi:MAG: DMT family transporter [Oligoflexia bacterium]|nr:DMT family transporter [Oligoflexia bacterium]